MDCTDFYFAARNHGGRCFARIAHVLGKHHQVWFAQAEAQFHIRKITEDETKFYYVVAALDQQTASRITDNLFPLTESFYAGVLYHTSVQPPGQNCVAPGLVREAPHRYTV